MSYLLNKFSFTARLVVLSAVILSVLVVVSYVALLEVPRRIARDTVEIALREHVQALNATFREERLRLREDTRTLVTEPRVRLMIINRDKQALEQEVSDRIGSDVSFQIRDASQNSQFIGVGPIVYIYTVRGQVDIAFYRQVDTSMLDAASATSDYDAPFALEHEGKFIAKSTGFPDSIQPIDAGEALEPDQALLKSVWVADKPLHMYSRTLSSDLSYQLHALSTPELEQAALAEITSDVRIAIGGITLTTMFTLLLFIVIMNASVKRFARRVGSLTDGDYSPRMSIHGRDGFAKLSQNVNQLSEQLELQLGQLEDTAQAFRRTLETLEDGICVWDESGIPVYWNRGAEQLTSLARERVEIDDPVIGFLRAERLPGVRRVTLPIRRSGGGLMVELVVTAMPGGGVLQTFRDTTMADTLQQTQRNFMATAAHELRTPITTIVGFADTLTNVDLELSERQRTEFINIIKEQAGQLQQIADAFFTNHQLANERVEVSLAATEAKSVIDGALRRVRKMFPALSGDVDAIEVTCERELELMADHRALVGVVAILVENAIKYGEAPISILVERAGGTITIMVTDHGPGIESHHHVRLFDPFYRIDVDMRSGVGGAGLGLFTARKLIEAMHGNIHLLSTPGLSTTFVLELPIVPSNSDLDESGTRSKAINMRRQLP